MSDSDTTIFYLIVMFSFSPKRYVVLGHSGIVNTNKDEIVPPGVRLVFLSECGYTYTRNWEHGSILKNKSLTRNFLLSNKVQHYEPGNKYRDQQINMPKKNTASLLHGIYRLPVNLMRKNRLPKSLNGTYFTRPINNRNNLSRGKESIPLSKILRNVSNKGGGTVIGIFCRGFENVSYSNIRGPARTARQKRRRAVSINTGGTHKRYLAPIGGIEKYKSLRETKAREPFLKAIKKAEGIRPIPRPPLHKKAGLFGRIFPRL